MRDADMMTTEILGRLEVLNKHLPPTIVVDLLERVLRNQLTILRHMAVR
jgi:hypothetical protein